MRQIRRGIFAVLVVLLSWTAPISADVSDHISAIEMSQTWSYSYPDAPFSYNFDIVVLSDTTVQGISFESPTGGVFNLTYVGSGEWEHAGSYATPEELNVYGDGDYVFTINYGGSFDTTSVFYGTPDGGVIPQVTQEPVITNPTHEQSQVSTTVILSWGQCTDTNANSIDIEWWPVDASGLEGWIRFEDCSVSRYGPVSLTPGRLYKASLAFNHAYFGINSDGIHYVVDKDSEGAVLFTTIPAPGWIPATIDIKPGSCPNPFNVKRRGVLPVAILGSEDFDVGMIDVASIRLAGVDPNRSGYEDVATLVMDGDECECTTDGPDGYLDLTLKFKTQDIVEALGEVADGEELVLTLTGVLLDETPIEGEDCIRVIKKKPLRHRENRGRRLHPHR